MTNEEIQQKLKEIKQSFRLSMNGPTAQSMRDKGVEYRVNWGVPFIDLKRMSKEIGQDYDLAIALWKEEIRECKILATLVMPADKMPSEVAEIWMEQTHSQEMAEMQAFNLYQYVPYAPELAYQWMAVDGEFYQICAYNIMSRLFMRGQEPNERGIHEFLDQAMTSMKADSQGISHSAMNAIRHFSNIGLMYERVAKSALQKEGIELLQ